MEGVGTYLVLIRVRHGNALGSAVDITGLALPEAGQDGGLLRVLGGRGGIGGRRGDGRRGRLGTGEDGESASNKDATEAHVGRFCGLLVLLSGMY